MSKNLMPEILKMLGVEYDEKFNLRAVDSAICEDGLFYFDKENGFLRFMDEEHTEEVYDMVYDVVSGFYEIVKLPWEPKEGDKYYAPSLPTKSICIEIWRNEKCDYALKALGMVYRTQEEAEAHFAEDYEKLTGKKLEV